MEHETDNGHKKWINSDFIVIKLNEEEHAAGNIAADDPHTVNSQPRDEQIGCRVLDTRNAENVAEEKDELALIMLSFTVPSPTPRGMEQGCSEVEEEKLSIAMLTVTNMAESQILSMALTTIMR